MLELLVCSSSFFLQLRIFDMATSVSASPSGVVPNRSNDGHVWRPLFIVGESGLGRVFTVYLRVLSSKKILDNFLV
jgi:hypothetical protein